MIIALMAISAALLLAYALFGARPRVPSTPEAPNQRRWRPGTFVHAGRLTRALAARAAVRGDDGYVQVRS